MPPMPASMLRTKRSWPGTSTKPMRMGSPDGAAQFKVGEADVDRDAAALFLLQTVGIDAGEGPNQGALAVVNVTGSANNDGFHSCQFTEVFVELRSRNWGIAY